MSQRLVGLVSQLKVVEMRVMLCHAEIVSGAYRQVKVNEMRVGLDSEGREILVNVPLTCDELLERKVQTMKRHVERAEDIKEHILEQIYVKGEDSGEAEPGA